MAIAHFSSPQHSFVFCFVFWSVRSVLEQNGALRNAAWCFEKHVPWHKDFQTMSSNEILYDGALVSPTNFDIE